MNTGTVTNSDTKEVGRVAELTHKGKNCAVMEFSPSLSGDKTGTCAHN